MISAPPPRQVKGPTAGQENCDQGREEGAHLAEAQRGLLTGTFTETGLYLPTSQESSPKQPHTPEKDPSSPYVGSRTFGSVSWTLSTVSGRVPEFRFLYRPPLITSILANEPAAGPSCFWGALVLKHGLHLAAI